MIDSPTRLLHELISSSQWREWIGNDPFGCVTAVISVLVWITLVRVACTVGLLFLAGVGSEKYAPQRQQRAAALAPRWALPLIAVAVGTPLLVGTASAATPIPSLDRPGASASPTPVLATPVPATPLPSVAGHVVKPGECLWTIAADALGPQASNSQIATSWPKLWKANAQRIGQTPNLIQPGWVLTPPPSS